MSEGWDAQVNRDREFWERAGEWIQQSMRSAKPSDAPITDEELEEGWQSFKAQYPGLFAPIERVQSDCKVCYGYGMWDDDSGQPMGPLDGTDGMPTRACPECEANQNPRLDHIAPDGVIPVVVGEDRHRLRKPISTGVELSQEQREDNLEELSPSPRLPEREHPDAN